MLYKAITIMDTQLAIPSRGHGGENGYPYHNKLGSTFAAFSQENDTNQFVLRHATYYENSTPWVKVRDTAGLGIAKRGRTKTRESRGLASGISGDLILLDPSASLQGP